MARQQKTPRQRAQEQLDVANRHVIRLDKKVEALKAELAVVEREHREAVTRQKFLRQHPDLEQSTTPTTPSGATS